MSNRAWLFVCGLITILFFTLPALYTWLAMTKAPDEIWSWGHQLVATFVLKDETLKLSTEAKETKTRLMERSHALTEGTEEPSEADREKSSSAVDQSNHDHSDYFRNLIEKSNNISGLQTS